MTSDVSKIHQNGSKILDSTQLTGIQPSDSIKIQPPESISPLIRSKKSVETLLLANPSKFYGQNQTTSKLRQDAQTTANLVNSSNILDFFTNYPIFFFLFSDCTLIVQIIFATACNLFILKFTKEAATGAASYHPLNKLWSRAAILGFVGLSSLQAFSAGVGVELTLNQPNLSRLRASEIIDEKTNQVTISAEKAKNQVLATSEKDILECNRLGVRIKQLEGENRKPNVRNQEYDSVYVRAYGELGADWSQSSTESLPVCKRIERVKKQAEDNYAADIQAWETTLKDRENLGEVAFLKKYLKQRHAEYFTGNDRVNSGVELARLALKSFFGKLSNRDLSSLGLSLFIFLISLITSTTACLITISYALREDVQRSWYEPNSLYDENDEIFGDAVEPKTSALPSELLSEIGDSPLSNTYIRVILNLAEKLTFNQYLANLISGSYNTENESMDGDNFHVNTSGGDSFIKATFGTYIKGDYIKMSQDLPKAASEIQLVS
ncbi:MULTISPECIES: hypothetical protein [unclassified Microcoleus]|uniref:hypothetical protein n=1 Tax=unclassified Microcoleus TaxID=2642155 RepID=UPI0025EAB018|nr:MULTISPECIES: hypothetical protein [unclassified Microcoleus]